MSDRQKHSLAEINEYFTANGAWEQNNGPRQSELFAHYFDRVITFQEKKFTLLDVGCALGQAAAFFACRYPEAEISATDISDVAISRAREQYGDSVQFFTEDIARLEGQYDVIYCSNVLEHFHDFTQKTRTLATCCKRLCIMVPYNERKRDGSRLVPDAGNLEHQYSFYEDSFGFLLDERLAVTINTEVISCPGAWGWNRRQRITHCIDNFFRKVSNRPRVHEPLQIIYDIKTT
ncbi:MAG: class I SAM-dependent methyltransferase [Thermodesulfobacteriota bacterium]|nr:class I SAM-dependent methyltransferase [Thermodesulfobacteriota bacterium]